ncbi:hypothetical protein CCACVL1_08743 [Corchorus capsularis]|uniref:Uncharacterized protein n=1 Tax=Corchorus capsularis TaxID=210143 RepID=A0A1R3IZ38_COCAP|nr:hypothetical protein CCACVL1_08743 [Corchorus capsularis]
MVIDIMEWGVFMHLDDHLTSLEVVFNTEFEYFPDAKKMKTPNNSIATSSKIHYEDSEEEEEDMESSSKDEKFDESIDSDEEEEIERELA